MTTEQGNAAGKGRTASGPYFQSEERPQVPHPGHGNADVLAQTAKARQSEQGDVKEEGSVLFGTRPTIERQIAALAGLQRRAVTPFGRTAEPTDPRLRPKVCA